MGVIEVKYNKNLKHRVKKKKKKKRKGINFKRKSRNDKKNDIHAKITAIIVLLLMFEMLVISLFAMFSFISLKIIFAASLFKE